MKSLLILRHGKSSWKNPNLPDHERPLNRRGKRNAAQIGLLIQKENLTPDVIYASSAKRTRATAKRVAKKSNYSGLIFKVKDLYLATGETYLHLVHQGSDSVNCVLLVGHNPGLEELLTALTGEQSALPTAALAQVELPIDTWSEIGHGVRGSLKQLWKPCRSTDRLVY